MSLLNNKFFCGATLTRKILLFTLIAVFLMCHVLNCLSKGKDSHLPFYIKKNGKKYYGYIDRNGKIKIPPVYSYAEDFSEGLAAVKFNGEWGYIDKQGNIIIEPQFERANEFCEGLAAVKINGKYGFIDKTGNVAISPKYEFVPFGEFSGGFAIVNEEINGKDNFIDKKGNFIRKDNFDHILPFSEGLAPVEVRGKWGFTSSEGKLVIPFKFDKAYTFSEGLAVVVVKSQCGYIDKSGKFHIQPSFDGAGEFSEGLAAVKKGKLWGYINKKGDVVINPKFHSVSNFSEGLANIRLEEGVNCFIDRKGRIKFCPDIPGSGDFLGGIARIVLPQLGGESIVQYYNKSGKLIWESPED
jgi:hypothetical protein